MILYLRLVIAFIPTQLYKILPYVVTVIVLIISEYAQQQGKAAARFSGSELLPRRALNYQKRRLAALFHEEETIMSTLLIKNIRTLVSCDSADTVYENVDLYAENGFIKAIGASLDRKADKTIDASHMLCYPGLVNTHHHLYQVFSRNLPQVQNMELFDWLNTLYEIWKNLDADVIRLSSLTGMGELMKHGCTTCFDHHYVFPAGCRRPDRRPVRRRR